MRPYDWLAPPALRTPDAGALDDGRTQFTYAELDRRADEVATDMGSQGVEAGSTVLLRLGKGLDKAIQVHALIRLRATIVPVENDLPREEIARATEAIRPDHEIGPELESVGQRPGGLELERPEPSDVLCRILTGGSTGRPKAISLTRENHFTSAVGSALNLGVEPDDRWFCPVSLSHVSGFSILIRSVIAGTGVFLTDHFNPETLVEATGKRGVNCASLVPTMLRRTLEHGIVPEGLRFVLVGGGPVAGELVLEAIEAGIPAVPTYGLTEACSQVATSTPTDAAERPSSAGRPLSVTEVWIDDGEILARGPTISRDAVGEDGWLRTGDLGRLDDEGYLFVEGRRDRAILTGGEKVQPVEVEEVLQADPSVSEAVVFGIPDPEWQEAIVAVVAGTRGEQPDVEALRRTCHGKLAGFKVPKRVVAVDFVPLNRAGKPDLNALIELVGGADR
ncbi:MAG: AMP-binding protein [Solirubrobacterales bacterium]